MVHVHFDLNSFKPPLCCYDEGTGQFMTDWQNPRHPHRCVGVPENDVRGEQLRRQALADVSRTGEQVGPAFRRIGLTLTIRYGREDDATRYYGRVRTGYNGRGATLISDVSHLSFREEIRKTACFNVDATKQAIRRPQKKKYPKVETLDAITDQLRTTFRGRHVDIDDAKYQER
jgi:hypothetical protein